MEDKIKKRTYIALTVGLTVGIILNFTSWQNPLLGIMLGLCYFFFCATITGTLVTNRLGWNILLGTILVLSGIASFGAALIFLHLYTPAMVLLLIALLPAGLYIPYYTVSIRTPFSFWRLFSEYRQKFSERREPRINTLLTLIYLGTAGTLAYLIWHGRTNESIQSPWEVINPWFFSIYALSSAILLIYLFTARRTKLPLTLLVIHSLISTSIACIVYTLGYGFDPFIHQATERLVLPGGGINPTPLYYLGQYAIVIFLHIISVTDITLIDRTLVPILYATCIPLVIYYVFSQWLRRTDALVLAAATLILPFGGFIMTTPQNLANVFFIITILLSLLYFRNEIGARTIGLLVLATLAIHPLAGIPLALTITLFALFKGLYRTYHRFPSLYVMTALTFIVIMPLAFLAIGAQPGVNPPFRLWQGLLPGHWANGGDLFLDIAYILYWNRAVFAILVITLGIFFIARAKLLKNNISYIVAAIIIFANFIVAKYFFTFPSLRDYDQSSFVSRLATLAFYVLLPFFLLGYYWLVRRAWRGNWLLKFITVTTLSGTMTIALYMSYPRVNSYEPAKFFSVGRSDVEAVHYIEQHAAPNHIVLANQMIGVTAISQFGFKRYIGDQFYYSMPSGRDQSLYNSYLDMIYQGAKRSTMEEAMDIGATDEAYFVLNRYWNNFEKIAASARESADSVTEIDGGRVYVFTYKR